MDTSLFQKIVEVTHQSTVVLWSVAALMFALRSVISAAKQLRRMFRG